MPQVIAGGGVAAMAQQIAMAWVQVMQTLMTAWAATASDAGSLTITNVITADSNDLAWVVGTIALMVAGTRMVIASSRAQEAARDIFRGLVLLSLISVGGHEVIQQVRGIFDSAATAIIATTKAQTALGAGFEASTSNLAQAKPGLTLLITLIGALVGLAQYVMLLFREPVLAILTGILPIAAAAAMSGSGLQWLKRIVGWIFSFVIYKYLAAVIYAAAFTAVEKSTDIGSLLTGLALMFTSVAALPALIRLITPMADALGTGGGATNLVTTAVGMGAMRLSKRSGKGTSSSSSGTGTAKTGKAGLRTSSSTEGATSSRRQLTAPPNGGGKPPGGGGPPPAPGGGGTPSAPGGGSPPAAPGGGSPPSAPGGGGSPVAPGGGSPSYATAGGRRATTPDVGGRSTSSGGGRPPASGSSPPPVPARPGATSPVSAADRRPAPGSDAAGRVPDGIAPGRGTPAPVTRSPRPNRVDPSGADGTVGH